jgi:DNA-binding HxlR family transcriptional regulator
MKRTSFAGMNCSIARTLEIVGEWWTLLILRDASRGITRFDDLQASLGIARNVLASRLGTLVELGILEKRRYQQRPDRYEYRLTERGLDLVPVLVSLLRWGDRWAAPGAPPVVLVHDACGHDAKPVLTCSHCDAPITPGSLRAERGPGAEPAAGPGPDAARSHA